MATQNTLFAIMNVSNPSALKSVMPSVSPWVYMELKDGEWLLVAPNATTTEEVSARLGFNEPGKDTALILRVENYFGRNYSTVWEWIKTKRGALLDTAASVEG
jgi:hypothetical protein